MPDPLDIDNIILDLILAISSGLFLLLQRLSLSVPLCLSGCSGSRYTLYTKPRSAADLYIVHDRDKPALGFGGGVNVLFVVS